MGGKAQRTFVSLASSKGSDLVNRAGGFVDVTCAEFAAFRTWPASEMDKVMLMLGESSQRRHDGRLPAAKFEELQQACGMRCNANGLLASSRLRSHCSLLGIVTFDWVHTLLQDGVFVLEASLVVKACGDHMEAMWRQVAQAAQAS